MKRKLIQVGGSLAVTLPAKIIQEYGLERGMTVDVTVHPRSGAVIVRPGVKYVQGGEVTKAFERGAKDLLRRRSDLYRRLAK